MSVPQTLGYLNNTISLWLGCAVLLIDIIHSKIISSQIELYLNMDKSVQIKVYQQLPVSGKWAGTSPGSCVLRGDVYITPSELLPGKHAKSGYSLKINL